MAQIVFDIPTYHGDTPGSKPDALKLRDAAQAALDEVRTAPKKLVFSLAPSGLVDGDAHAAFAVMPEAGTVTAVQFIADNVATGDSTVGGTAAGSVTSEGANSLLAANVDLKDGINGQLKAGTLTATVANRTLAAGSVVAAGVAVAGTSGAALGLTCIITYTPI